VRECEAKDAGPKSDHELLREAYDELLGSYRDALIELREK
jgi:hypothetical protein